VALGRLVGQTVKIHSADTSADSGTFERQDGSILAMTVRAARDKTSRCEDEVGVACTKAVAVVIAAAPWRAWL